MFNPGMLENLGHGMASWLITWFFSSLVAIDGLRAESTDGLRAESTDFCCVGLLFMSLGAFMSGIPRFILRHDFSTDLSWDWIELLKSSDDLRYVSNLCLMTIFMTRLSTVAKHIGNIFRAADGGFESGFLLKASGLTALLEVICSGTVSVIGFISFMSTFEREMSAILRPGRDRISASQRICVALLRAIFGAYILCLLRIAYTSALISRPIRWAVVPFSICATSHLLLSAAHTVSVALEVLKIL